MCEEETYCPGSILILITSVTLGKPLSASVSLCMKGEAYQVGDSQGGLVGWIGWGKRD